MCLLEVRKLDEDLKLLFFREILHLDLNGRRGRLFGGSRARNERLHAPLHHVQFHLTLVEGLHVHFENEWIWFVLQDPQKELYVSIVQFSVNGVWISEHSGGETYQTWLFTTVPIRLDLSHSVSLGEA